jgi:uncharacterized protein YdaU (DUF1376 family)
VNYYPHHIGDYLRDTVHLTMVEDAAYRRMLDLYYASEKPLPLDFEYLCRLVRARETQEREATHSILSHFFQKCEDGWRNKRADEEIRKGKARVKAARVNGKRGGRPITQRVSRNNPAGSRSDNPELNYQNQKPKPKAKEEKHSAVALPEWLPQEAWTSFEENRKELRKPLTKRAKELVLTELGKLRQAGHEPAAVLLQSVRKGWLDVFPLKDQPKAYVGEVI